MSEQADYFSLFALPRRYGLERPALEAAYERLTLAHHPDFFATAPEAERQQAGRLSARVNEGYRVLRNDLARAEHLLALLAGGRELDKTALTPEFLGDVFELHEEAEALTGTDDAPQLKEIRRKVEAELEAIRMHIAAIFQQAADVSSVEALQSIQSDLNCARYLQRLLDRLNGERDD